MQDYKKCVCVCVGAAGAGGGFLRSGRGRDTSTNFRTYPNRKTGANSVDPDQTPQNAASVQGLNCLSLIQQLKTHC